MADTFLLDLFREEVRAHSQVLNEGLVALEGSSVDAKQIEPLMRAAHSIKGAARVVAVERRSRWPTSWRTAWSRCKSRSSR